MYQSPLGDYSLDKDKKKKINQKRQNIFFFVSKFDICF